MNTDLVVFGEDWGGLPSSTQHLIRHLSQERRVLWINSIGLRQPSINQQDLSRVCAKLRSALRPEPKAASEPAPFPVLSPITIPAPRSPMARHLSSLMLLRQLKPVMQHMGMSSPIVWASLPTAVDIAGQLNARALVYYCGDDFGALAGVDHYTVLQREAELVQRAQLVMASSQSLVDRFPEKTTRLLPHGVSFSLFSEPVAAASEIPTDGRPIAGFYGSLSEWLDLDLLHAVITRLPHWHFMFVGSASVDISALTRLHNVHWLGNRPHHQLPQYSQHWSACLLPFKDNAQIRACNPLKLREYLATGRPVVSTPFPSLAPYRQFIHQVQNAEEMIQALEQCQHSPRNPQQMSAVADADWSVQAQQVGLWLDQL